MSEKARSRVESANRNRKKQKGVGREPARIVTGSHREMEQYAVVRSNIKFKLAEYDMKTLAVTSSIMGEGKTTTSLNLAISFARDGFKVLLVDSDLRRPNIGRSLGISDVKGLSTLVMERERDVKDFLIEVTRVPNLWVLPSGLSPHNPAEMLGSKRMKAILDELREAFDLVIIDLPPIGVVTDAQVVSAQVDATLLVVRDEYVRKQEVQQAVDLLKMGDVQLIGVVLNAVKRGNDEYGGYSGYGSY